MAFRSGVMGSGFKGESRCMHPWYPIPHRLQALVGMDKKKEAFAEVHDADETPVHAEMSTWEFPKIGDPNIVP